MVVASTQDPAAFLSHSLEFLLLEPLPPLVYLLLCDQTPFYIINRELILTSVAQIGQGVNILLEFFSEQLVFQRVEFLFYLVKKLLKLSVGLFHIDEFRVDLTSLIKRIVQIPSSV